MKEKIINLFIFCGFVLIWVLIKSFTLAMEIRGWIPDFLTFALVIFFYFLVIEKRKKLNKKKEGK